mmetsp:Transcript_36754/g.82349  ORF Transcript_36754/g.82349 Transcript_36754/m.82349 type:complete len:207 (-) Transcript_36754:348-968(-)
MSRDLCSRMASFDLGSRTGGRLSPRRSLLRAPESPESSRRLARLARVARGLPAEPPESPEAASDHIPSEATEGDEVTSPATDRGVTGTVGGGAGGGDSRSAWPRAPSSVAKSPGTSRCLRPFFFPARFFGAPAGPSSSPCAVAACESSPGCGLPGEAGSVAKLSSEPTPGVFLRAPRKDLRIPGSESTRRMKSMRTRNSGNLMFPS